MATEYVHSSWKRESSEETACAVRLAASGMGMFSYESRRTPGQVASCLRISCDLFRAKGIESSVNRTTPAPPSDRAMIQSALIFARPPPSW